MKLTDIHSDEITFLLQAHIIPALEKMLPDHPLKHRGGWYYLGKVLENTTCVTILHGWIGNMEKDRIKETYFFSKEKAHRLAEHPAHMSSRESAQEQSRQYPGALRYANNLIGSFSGYPADVDEAIVAFVGVQQKFVDEETIWGRLGEAGQKRYVGLINTMGCFPSKYANAA